MIIKEYILLIVLLVLSLGGVHMSKIYEMLTQPKLDQVKDYNQNKQEYNNYGSS